MSGSCREASQVVGTPSQMSMSDWEALPDVWEWSEALLHVQELSGGPPACPGETGRPSRMSV